jgi:Fe-S cluster assembly protein SufD
MASPVESPSTPVVGSFTAEAFAAHLAAQSTSPAWWLERKRAAYEKFAALPMPRRTDEAWRFSKIAGLTLDGFAPPGADGVSGKAGTVNLASAAEARAHATAIPFKPSAAYAAQLYFRNNRPAVRQDLSAEACAKGVIVSTLSEALQTHSEILRSHFMAQPQKLGSEKFAALHAAFVEDGAFILIPRGVELDEPIFVVHVADGDGAAVFPHTLVVAEENSKATIVDFFVSSGAGLRQLAVGANDLYAGHGARLTYAGVQNWSRSALSLQLNSTVVRRDARVQSVNVHLGAGQARHESLSQLQAPGAFSEMLAMTIAEGTQEFDQRTLQLHQAPNTKSDLLYKNALLDTARTIFSGLIIVDPDAQKTDAYQSNRNLMLSDDAEANSLPGLEIQANDVRCTHGATTSRIDPEQEFYLLTRGIAPEQAHQLLIFGFFEEVLNRLESDSLHAALRELIATKFKT